MPFPKRTLILPALPAETACALEAAAGAIGRLDARICASPAAPAWRLRAAWSGYAAALRGQRVEIDDIDVFCWGCGIDLPQRARRLSLVDDFASFEGWRAALEERQDRHWREALPFAPDFGDGFGAAPRIIRAVELTRQHALADPRIAAWLGLPRLLARLGAATTPLPCLVLADPALRRPIADPDALLRRSLKALAKQADAGLERCNAIEADRSRAAHALASSGRPGALLPLMALAMRLPVLSPKTVSQTLHLTLSGAGKLLARAAALGLVREVSDRRSWRVYLMPDLAVALGFMTPPRGRPPSPPPPPTPGTPLASLFAQLDQEIAAIDARWPGDVGPDLVDAAEIDSDEQPSMYDGPARLGAAR